MIVYTEGRILAVSKESFTDAENQKVEYCVNVIKTQQGIMTFNSKKDFSEFENTDSVIVLRLTEDAEKKNRFKVSIVEVRKGDTLGLPESEIH